jgi:hypothetical protein
VRRIFAFLVILVLAAPASSAAHRLDEYLQASRLAIGREEIGLELDLTPGASIAAHVVALVDRDADGTISPLEAEAYGRSAVRALVLEVDGRAVPLALTRVEASRIGEMMDGAGSIQIVAVGRFQQPVAAGTRHLRFRNDHHPDSSVYLVNALVPRSPEIVVAAQSRDTSQREIHLEYDLRPAWPIRLVWLTLGLAGVGVLFVTRKAKASPMVWLLSLLLLPLHS